MKLLTLKKTNLLQKISKSLKDQLKNGTWTSEVAN